jgi:hypothetical protein
VLFDLVEIERTDAELLEALQIEGMDLRACEGFAASL